MNKSAKVVLVWERWEESRFEVIRLNNILKHPATEFSDLVRHVESLEFDSITRLLIFALDNKLATKPIVDLLGTDLPSHKPSNANLRVLLEWCDSKNFISEEKSFQETAPINEVSPTNPDPKREKVFKEIRDLGAQRAEGNNFGWAHKYWFFRPAWEMDTALWEQIFGEDDPANVIAFYLSSFFKRPVAAPEHRTIILTADDLFVFEWLLHNAAADICRGETSKTQSLIPVMQGAIATACRLENVLDLAIRWTSPEFLIAINEASEELAQYLLVYWSERIDFWSELSASNVQQMVEQAHFMAACLLKHVARDAGFSDFEVPTFSFISDRTIVCIWDSIAAIEIDADAQKLQPVIRLLSEKIYQARDTRFGGRFPFTIHGAKHFIGPLAQEKGYWLADIGFYDAEAYEPELDLFGLYSAMTVIHLDDSIRTNWRAQRRYEAYRDALASMEEDGLRELACAWWAFFIASQILAFPGFGLPGREQQELVKKAESLTNDRMVAKAVQFALAQERSRPTSLASRTNLALLRELVAKAEETTGAQIIHVGVSPAQIEAYIQVKIKPPVWEALSEQSRRDLVEAEQIWCRAAPEFGAGRSDWGALIALYSRPIEAEVRSHLGPLLEQLGEAGLCEVSELTLGGCVRGIREAKKAIRTRSSLMSPERSSLMIPERVISRVASLHEFFGRQATFLETFRNRAAHANREEPITAGEFLQWRIAIFEDGLFAMILGN